MISVLKAAKLVTAAWLARHWNVAPLPLRVPLAIMALAIPFSDRHISAFCCARA